MRRTDFLRTTAFRLSLAIAGFFTLSSIVVFAFVYWQAVVYASHEIDQQVEQTAHAISNVKRSYIERRVTRWLGEQGRIARYGILLNEQGVKVAGNLASVPPGVQFDEEIRTLILKQPPGVGDAEYDRVRAVALRTDDGFSLVVAEDTDEWEYFRDILLRALFLGLVPIVALGCVGGALFGRSTLARMAAMDRSFDRIIHGDLSERLPRAASGRSDEFDRLAGRVNLVLDDLQRLLLESQAVGDSIAHDLRTPLTRMRARLENTRKRAQSVEELRAAVEEGIYWLDQTMGVIAAVLRIGEIEHGRRRAAFRSFGAAALAREVHELMEPLAEDKHIRLELRIANGDAEITGDRELLLEALVNLVDNAIKFTPAGGACAIEVASEEEGCTLRVEDNGPGILEAERSAVLRRFYKANGGRSAEGAGLGLALVAAVTRLHDFRLTIGDNRPGCVVEISAITHRAPKRDPIEDLAPKAQPAFSHA